MTTITRRSALAAIAAAPAALKLSEAAAENSELRRLIEAHKAAFQAHHDAINQLNALDDKLRREEPVVPCSLGGGFSLRCGRDFCREHILNAYIDRSRHLKPFRKVAPELIEALDRELHAKQQEDLFRLDSMWEASGMEEADRALDNAGDAETDALLAVVCYRCRSLDEARLKAEYLLTTAVVKDTWEDQEKALLESFVYRRKEQP